MKKRKPKGCDAAVLDLGAAHVEVSTSDDLSLEDNMGRSDFVNYRIVLAKGMNGQAILPTLMHEILHFGDYLYFANALDDEKGHKLLDQISVYVDQVLSRNWLLFKSLYDAKQRKKR